MSHKIFKTTCLLGLVLFGTITCKPKGSSSNLGGAQHTYSPSAESHDDLYSQLLQNKIDDDINSYAFSLLTPSGKELFGRMRQYIDIQKKDSFQDLAQALECSRNVSHVLHNQGKAFETSPDVPPGHQSIQKLKHDLCTQNAQCYEFSQTGDPSAFLNFLKEKFPKGIPTGTVVFGLHKEKTSGSSGHSALVGDKDHNGNIMLYHNNWLRPGSLPYGSFEQLKNQTDTDIILRQPYMVPVKDMYIKERARSWMPTPWIKLYYNEDKTIENYKITTNTTDLIDDLSPNDSKYKLYFIVPEKIYQEVSSGNIIKFHRKLPSHQTNIHSIDLKNPRLHNPDHNHKVCVIKKTFRHLSEDYPDLRSHEFFRHYVSSWSSKEKINPVDRILEFYGSPHPDDPNSWLAKIFVQDSARAWGGRQLQFWGGTHNSGTGHRAPISIPKSEAICKTTMEWFQCTNPATCYQ